MFWFLVFYFRNHQVLLGKQEHVTRFISLAPFLNKDNKKVGFHFHSFTIERRVITVLVLIHNRFISNYSIIIIYMSLLLHFTHFLHGVFYPRIWAFVLIMHIIKNCCVPIVCSLASYASGSWFKSSCTHVTRNY